MKLKKLGVLAAILPLPALLMARDQPVTVSEDEAAFTLENGIVTARVAKHSGDLISLKYKDLEMLDVNSRQGGYWEHNTARSGQVIDHITIDPRANSGERGEVSVKGISNGTPLGTGPGGSVV